MVCVESLIVLLSELFEELSLPFDAKLKRTLKKKHGFERLISSNFWNLDCGTDASYGHIQAKTIGPFVNHTTLFQSYDITKYIGDLSKRDINKFIKEFILEACYTFGLKQVEESKFYCYKNIYFGDDFKPPSKKDYNPDLKISDLIDHKAIHSTPFRDSYGRLWLIVFAQDGIEVGSDTLDVRIITWKGRKFNNLYPAGRFSYEEYYGNEE